jgi:hypothetical protein
MLGIQTAKRTASAFFTALANTAGYEDASASYVEIGDIVEMLDGFTGVVRAVEPSAYWTEECEGVLRAWIVPINADEFGVTADESAMGLKPYRRQAYERTDDLIVIGKVAR